jgi:hypothetical protein
VERSRPASDGGPPWVHTGVEARAPDRALAASAAFYTQRPGRGVALWLHADGVTAVHTELVCHGVPIVTAPFDGPFGRTFADPDPDGYVVTLHG